MQENLDRALALVFGHEGGFSNRSKKADPGGATMFGITAQTLGNWRKLGRKATAAEVRALKPEEARAIVVSQYAKPIRFDDLPVGLDYAVLDFAVNSGPGQAVSSLQRVLGVPRDGVIGTNTLAAIRKADLATLIHTYCVDERLNRFMQRLKNWNANKRGWTIRVTGEDPKGEWAAEPGVVGNALAMAEGAEPTEVAPLNDIGGDAKAAPSEVAVSATRKGKGAIAAGIGVGTVAVSQAKDAVQPLLGSGGWVDTVFAGLVGVGVLLAIGGVVVNAMATKDDIEEGAPA